MLIVTAGNKPYNLITYYNRYYNKIYYTFNRMAYNE